MKHVNRRDFLKDSITLAAACACSARAMGTLGNNIVHAQTAEGNGNLWVGIVCDGGMDCLNSFDCPVGVPAYYQARPTLALQANQVLATESGRGFHPALTRIHQLWLEGKVAVVPYAGTKTRPTRSHDVEQDFYSLGADPGSGNGTGWLGRVIDEKVKRNGAGSVSIYNTMAIGMGIPLDTFCSRADKRPLNISNLGSYNFNNDNTTSNNDNPYRQLIHQRIVDMGGGASTMMTATSLAQKNVYQSIQTLRSAVTAYNNDSASATQNTFGNRSPGPQLRNIAMLMRAGLATQIALCGMGGYDLHSDLGTVTGNQADRLGELDRAVGTFASEMKRLGKWNNVVIHIYSEFGRTSRENGSGGVDHGFGQAEILIGGRIRGGYYDSIYSSDHLLGRDNAIPVKTDFRNPRREVLNFLDLNGPNIFPSYAERSLGLFV